MSLEDGWSRKKENLEKIGKMKYREDPDKQMF
jgi:hypothetical protein